MSLTGEYIRERVERFRSAFNESASLEGIADIDNQHADTQGQFAGANFDGVDLRQAELRAVDLPGFDISVDGAVAYGLAKRNAEVIWSHAEVP